MVDETTEAANKEQVVVCLRWERTFFQHAAKKYYDASAVE